jgi:hypothetical protein
VRICRAVHRPQTPDAGSVLARYTDGQGRPPRQREMYERHAAWLKANRRNVHDLTHEA